jgi:hypothetical protein
MDRKQSKSPSDRDERTDADGATADSVRLDSSVIYFCSAEEISEGFAIALRAMGFKTEILLSDILPQSNTTSNPEDR